MNIETVFDIYKAYSLTKISELNKQSLIAQYRQNEQLSQLNDELAKANQTAKQILRNQAKEIEQKEKQHYFKNVVFNLSQALELLENEEHVNFRIFASSIFLSPICDAAKDAVQELDEIGDKEYTQNIIKRANALSENDKKHIDSYQETPWSTFLSFRSNASQTVLQNKRTIRKYTPNRDAKEFELQKLLAKKRTIKEQYDNALDKGKINKTTSANELHVKTQGTGQDVINPKKRIKGCCLGCAAIPTIFFSLVACGALLTNDIKAVLVAIILLVVSYAIIGIAYYLIKDKNLNGFKFNIPEETKSNKAEILKAKLETLQQEIEPLQNELEAQDSCIQKLQQEIISLQAQYNSLLQKITADCSQWEKKLVDIAELIPHPQEKDYKDPLLMDAAKLIVKHQDASTSLIQRKFAIGYTRANRIMNQLERIGVVGSDKKVKCESEDEIIDLFTPALDLLTKGL